MYTVIDTKLKDFKIRFAQIQDTALILEFIRELAAFEKMETAVTASEDLLMESLFERKMAEVTIGEYNKTPVAFALFFHNFSTFLGMPGLYLEDLYVRSAFRGQGIGKIMLSFLAQLALDRKCGRLEWWCLDWNEPAIKFYQQFAAAVPMDEWTVYRVHDQALIDLAAKNKS